MRKFGLHLNALRAFESAARLNSFSRAAEELCVTHSTISHHILGLEERLGVKLFQRQNRRIVLTDAGRILFPALEAAFDRIFHATEACRSLNTKRSLNVTLTPAFADKWLVPRLKYFQSEHDNIEIRLSPSLEVANLERDGFHVGIRAGLGKWPNLRSKLLLPVHMTPLCSPDLLKGRREIVNAIELLDFPLLHADVSRGTGIESEWGEWFAAMGLSDVDYNSGLWFQDPGLALQAAINGVGIAMGYMELASDDLASGRLIRPFTEEATHPWSYYLVTPEAVAIEEQTEMFMNWISGFCNTD